MGSGDESRLARGRVGGQLLTNGGFDLKKPSKQASKQPTNETGKDEETGKVSSLPWDARALGWKAG